MSEIRKVELTLNLNTVEAIAKDLNLNVRHNDYVYGYSTKDIKMPLVVDISKQFSIGFDINKIIYDDWRDIAKNTLSNIMERYVTQLVTPMNVEKIRDTEKEIVLRIKV